MLGPHAVWSIEGCVTSASRVCTRTRAVLLMPADRAAYVSLWFAIRATPLCEPEGIFPGDRMFELQSAQGNFTGRLPANVADLAARNGGPCRAHARMAWWVAERFLAGSP